ncbi:hypothetical protein J4460_05460 [Candidatus Woesearchaeota archaeon]|nr:MAG: hypothetical protein QS99_C0015G0005 [archaeon GW2011_AR4]MBS3130093.1 hypothetical protein [Candidatus Woesearchaeota archaeon]HIH38710.1 hypothetical protein [Candidatus Woesearchaeota archaeon]HIH49308.1 hypothetical protein [Candidatus Woesearchaeota archaeon]HIJ03648.1 hypothetical protein [Candidatus Woesearchaeota archaeon]
MQNKQLLATYVLIICILAAVLFLFPHKEEVIQSGRDQPKLPLQDIPSPPNIPEVKATLMGNNLCDEMLCDGICKKGDCIRSLHIGVVYLYHDNETMSDDWDEFLNSLSSRMTEEFGALFDNRVNVSIITLGSFQASSLFWTPAKVGFLYEWDGSKKYGRMPGSELLISPALTLQGHFLESYCRKCTILQDNDAFTISLDQPGLFTYDTLIRRQGLHRLQEQVRLSFGYDPRSFDVIVYIFGNVGLLIPNDPASLQYRCTTIGGIVNGIEPGIVLGENSLRAGGLVNCSSVNATSFYDKPGWHIMMHEILHYLGAVDVYSAGMSEGIDQERSEALQVDSRVGESVMGDEFRSCMDTGRYVKEGVTCSEDELEQVYLDRYNRALLGFIDDHDIADLVNVTDKDHPVLPGII